MQLVKHTIRGKKGQTVCYTLPNLRFDDEDNCLKWDAFRFYTPEGEKTDSNGFQYFDVPEDSIPIERDDTLNKEWMLFITQDEGVEALEIFEGAKGETITLGMEGDIVASCYISTDNNTDIIVDYKEVTDG